MYSPSTENNYDFPIVIIMKKEIILVKKINYPDELPWVDYNSLYVCCRTKRSSTQKIILGCVGFRTQISAAKISQKFTAQIQN